MFLICVSSIDKIYDIVSDIIKIFFSLIWLDPQVSLVYKVFFNDYFLCYPLVGRPRFEFTPLQDAIDGRTVSGPEVQLWWGHFHFNYHMNK